MLRPSILYAADMYYNLKESELRQLERIEEEFLRKIFKTTRGCPISQLYLEIGHIPARFEVQKMRLLYLKYILEEKEESLLSRFVKLQLAEPLRGDWVSNCIEDLKELEIEDSLEEIKKMTKTKFSKILKTKVKENALKYLKEKQKSKGKEVQYLDIDMAEYLQPINSMLSINEKQELFKVRNRMTDIPDNFPKSEIKHICFCGEPEDMAHIYNCKILNEGVIQNEKYENIFNGNIDQQLKIFKKFEQNLEKREQLQKSRIEPEPPCDPIKDPLFSVAL